MQLTGVKPDEKTFASVLPACAGVGVLPQGMEIHDQIVESGFQSDVFFISAFIEMYEKFGSLEKVRKVFDNNASTRWGAVDGNDSRICYSLPGQGKALTQIMSLQFVLFACCHAGLVEEGCIYFSGMYGNNCRLACLPELDSWWSTCHC